MSGREMPFKEKEGRKKCLNVKEKRKKPFKEKEEGFKEEGRSLCNRIHQINLMWPDPWAS